MQRFPEKRVAITGAASGLGLALTRLFLSRGWRVALADIQDEAGESIVKSLQLPKDRAFYQRVDVTKVRDIQAWKKKIVETWGGLDVLINNAGVATHGAIDTAPLEDWDWVLNINLMGVVRGCRTFVPLFKKQKSGHVVNISSMAGLIHSPEMGSYNAAKAGVVAVSETLVGELDSFGVGTSVVCPGFFATNLARNGRFASPQVHETLEKLFASSKLSANDVAERIYDGVAKQDFYILPHRNYRFFWLLKRYLPAGYLASLRSLGKRLLAKRNGWDIDSLKEDHEDSQQPGSSKPKVA
ncbi:SDR family oxidoreductase [Hahella ganghwensis]|uniref:SDR family oxidoreductase n=1 Tax=Hahella ganghwensis TaxID=286420 RepID=UPI0003697193|nr:SDR family oxidoreductase [Hahella ganghwensis]